MAIVALADLHAGDLVTLPSGKVAVVLKAPEFFKAGFFTTSAERPSIAHYVLEVTNGPARREKITIPAFTSRSALTRVKVLNRS